MSLLPPRSSIGRLLVRSAPADAANAGMRVERALQTVEIVPSDLPAGALLCVRRLADPLPGHLGGDTHSRNDPYAWGKSVQQRLRAFRDTAARPQRGRLPSSSEAVYFASETELLSCLALSQADRRFLNEWWWADILGASWAERPWSSRWLESPKTIPSAFSKLAADGQLPTVLPSLTPLAARKLLSSVAQHFGLPVVAIYLTAQPLPVGDSNPPTSRRAKAADLAAYPSFGYVNYADDAAVIFSTAPEAQSESWQPEIRLLLALVLTLARRPTLARALSPGALSQVIEFISIPRSVHEAAATSPDRADISGLTAPPNKPRETIESEPRVAPPLNVASVPSLPPSHAEAISASTSPPATPPVDAAPRSDIDPGPSPHEFIVSEAGGVLYLLNVALHLGLYADFTQPRGFNLSLSPWDFIAALGQRLLPTFDREDPLWSCLERLSGRDPAEPPDAHWETPVDWHLPAGYSETSLLAPPDTESFQVWLDWLTPFVAQRLRRATGLEPATLLSAPVFFTQNGERIDAHFRLSLHPIEARTAGLDRDPGWMPAAGYSIFFHYE